MNFRKELETLINKASKENDSDTPDWILAQYLESCLNAFTIATRDRDRWWGPKVKKEHVPEPVNPFDKIDITFPKVVPQETDIMQQCPKCGLRLDQMLGYVCSHAKCPTGLGGSWC